ncbi:MAG: GNAT family N-acetyltransferase [Hydrogenophaga sp.]|uniref:GNAT family N-acetyltransferase n=1 Tax=Hydrogenophaga crocea TaxID=2716225 RepID=A0A6G8IKQ5_9BURK|nr:MULTISPECIES: GNAT family N-acetyltransferase [Hydrogenophaga]MBL0944864.1 GNAT family N-acetyltransferase [Hydrogenophaga sp.]QIM53595.1 GNAT family N-acetyltransferase [Hydrogenophaga crocea]
MAFAIHRGYLPGCIGRIAELHARYYAGASGFGLAFEAQVASELAAFCTRYEDGRDGLWLALLDGRVEASIAIDGRHAEREGAQLRWFIASDALRGRGVGRQLLGEALALCDARGYPRTRLWTFDQLLAARHLYEAHGFALARTERGAQWGTPVNEQLFVRERP